MVTLLDANYDLLQEFNGVVYKKTTVKKKTPLKLYIPFVMSNIVKGSKPEEGVLNTSGLLLFADTNKKPKISSKIPKTQNFLTASRTILNTTNEISDSMEQLTKYLRRAIDSEVQKIRKRSYKVTLNEGAIVRIQFVNGKLSKLSYQVNEDSNGIATDNETGRDTSDLNVID